MANALDAYNPTIWSRAGVAILREKCGLAKLVRRDFTNDLADFGDTVNTRKPGKMTAADVDQVNGVTAMDVSATNIAVTLNQHKHVTFGIKDAEASKSFKNLADEFLDPSMLAIAVAVETSLAGLYTDVTNTLTVSSAGDWRAKVNSARTSLNKKKCPVDGRVAVLSDDDEGLVGNLDILSKVNESGASGTLREGSVGRFKGFDFMRNSQIIGVGSPAQRQNLLYHPNAFALVMRPLRTATGRTPGAEQKVGVDPDAGLAIRITMSYSHTLFRTLISVDTLYGVKTLDKDLACLVKSSVTG